MLHSLFFTARESFAARWHFWSCWTIYERWQGLFVAILFCFTFYLLIFLCCVYFRLLHINCETNKLYYSFLYCHRIVTVLEAMLHTTVRNWDDTVCPLRGQLFIWWALLIRQTPWTQKRISRHHLIVLVIMLLYCSFERIFTVFWWWIDCWSSAAVSWWISCQGSHGFVFMWAMFCQTYHKALIFFWCEAEWLWKPFRRLNGAFASSIAALLLLILNLILLFFMSLLWNFKRPLIWWRFANSLYIATRKTAALALYWLLSI